MLSKILKQILTLRWNPGKDVVVVLASWVLLTTALYTATMIVGPETGGGLPYFFIYALLTATVLGIGIPVAWMVFYRKRPLSDLGVTTRWLGMSLLLQLVFAAFEIVGVLNNTVLPVLDRLLPLIALSLAIGFFEAVFWRGWVLMRLEEAFGFIPAALLGSALYALYHIGYGMPVSEIAFLFFIGLMYAAAFRLTRNIFILWPIFQPAGQLITLLKDGLELPLLASVGFFEVLIIMGVILWLANKYHRKGLHRQALASSETPSALPME